jgi:serine phosphatase RsbU (regulator of sigma subunit)
VDEEDADEEPFGREGLLKAVTEVKKRSSAEIRDHILNRIQAYAAAEEAVDDTTLVVIRRLRAAAGGTLDAQTQSTPETGGGGAVM